MWISSSRVRVGLELELHVRVVFGVQIRVYMLEYKSNMDSARTENMDGDWLKM
jgi:hypothetical protein